MPYQDKDFFLRRQQEAQRRRRKKAVRRLWTLATMVLVLLAVWKLTTLLKPRQEDLAPLLRNTPAPQISAQISLAPAATQEAQDWRLLLVNRDHPLPQNYEIETMEMPGGEKVDKRIYDSLKQMLDDMETEGIYGVVVSGYRTAEKQQQIMDERIAQYLQQGASESEARQLAEEWVAVPGTSEHQLGLAVDINADGIHSTGQEVYDWLLEHADAYGFIKRYPEDKTEITGISNEPWHYRYVGEEAAQEMKAKNQCLEEYLESRKTSSEL